MTDFLNKNGTPNYEPLTDGMSYQQNTPTPNQAPIQVNQIINSYEKNATYTTPCHCLASTFLIFLFFLCTLVSAYVIGTGIFENNIKVSLSGLALLIPSSIAILIASTFNIYVVIKISSTLGTIVIKRRKLCFCFNEKEVVQINDLDQVIIEKDEEGSFASSDVFKINFKLLNGRYAYVCRGINNKTGEGRRAYNIIRNALPQRIGVIGSFAY